MENMIDIVIFAVVAVFLFARLWAVFGQRNDNEKDRRNPFAPKNPGQTGDEPPIIRPTLGEASSRLRAEEDEPFVVPPVPLPPQSLAGGIEAIQKRDPSFDEKQFLAGAKSAFSMIIGDFAKGDLSRVERFLAPAVLAGFKEAVRLRQENQQTFQTEIKDWRGADVIAARVDGDTAYLTVEFTTLQTNILRGPDGAIVGGEEAHLEIQPPISPVDMFHAQSPILGLEKPDENQVAEVRDIWTFARDLRSRDPNWMLIGTKS
jgi:predicted lipid-binding transport protein (Tim44 family)